MARWKNKDNFVGSANEAAWMKFDSPALMLKCTPRAANFALNKEELSDHDSFTYAGMNAAFEICDKCKVVKLVKVAYERHEHR